MQRFQSHQERAIYPRRRSHQGGRSVVKASAGRTTRVGTTANSERVGTVTASHGVLLMDELFSCALVRRSARRGAAGSERPDSSMQYGDPSRAISGMGQLRALRMTGLLRSSSKLRDGMASRLNVGAAGMRLPTRRRSAADRSRYSIRFMVRCERLVVYGRICEAQSPRSDAAFQASVCGMSGVSIS